MCVSHYIYLILSPQSFPNPIAICFFYPLFFFLISINSQFILTVAQTRYLGLIPDASFSPKFYILWMNKSCHLYLYDIFRFQTIFIIFTTTTMVWVSLSFKWKMYLVYLTQQPEWTSKICQMTFFCSKHSIFFLSHLE